MKHFTIQEFLQSATAKAHGIDMTPTPAVASSLEALCVNVLDPLRERLGRPVRVSSGYRPKALNPLVGGANSSQHTLGEAADISVMGMTSKELCEAIIKFGLPFDQLIEEFGAWTHVSYRPNGRGQVLTARRGPTGKALYTKGLT